MSHLQSTGIILGFTLWMSVMGVITFSEAVVGL